MEDQKEAPKNGAANPTTGATGLNSKAQGEKTEVKEGNPTQQRPQYGAEGGPNTATRAAQLPTLNDGAKPKGEEDTDLETGHS